MDQATVAVLSGERNRTTCPIYFNYVEFMQHKSDGSLIDRITRITMALSAIIVLPNLIFGACLNAILSILLLSAVKKLGRGISSWGPKTALIDTCILVVNGLALLTTTYSTAWWGYELDRSMNTTLIGCRMMNIMIDWLSTLRINTLFFISVGFLRSNEAEVETSTIKIRAIWTLVGIGLTTVQVGPTIGIYEFWQHSGRFDCLPGPQWHRVYHIFIAIHFTLMNDGLLQAFCTSILSILAFMKAKRYNQLLGRLEWWKSTDPSIDRGIQPYRKMLKEYVHCARLLFCIVVPTTLSRILRCVLRWFSCSDYIVLKGDKECSHWLDRIYAETIWRMAQVGKNIFLSFLFVWWYMLIPELAEFLKTMRIINRQFAHAVPSKKYSSEYGHKQRRSFHGHKATTNELRKLRDHLMNELVDVRRSSVLSGISSLEFGQKSRNSYIAQDRTL